MVNRPLFVKGVKSRENYVSKLEEENTILKESISLVKKQSVSMDQND